MTGETLRPLSPDDLEAVIAIDRSLSATARRGFFESRLQAALETPADHVHVGLEARGALAGFALARLVGGEFGKPGGRAVLDAIGVDPACQHEGAGHALIDAVKAVLRRKRVSVLESQVGWSDRALLGFFGDTGFALAPRMVLVGDSAALARNFAPEEPGAGGDAPASGIMPGDGADFSSPLGDAPGALALEPIPVRAMDGGDLDRITRIDRHLSGRDRRPYLQRKLREMLRRGGVRLSLVAELDGLPVGFVMARLDYGDFGLAAPEAVLDTLGVHPDFQGQGVGRALMAQLLSHLGGLQVGGLRSEIAWNDIPLIAFLSGAGLVPGQRVALDARL